MSESTVDSTRGAAGTTPPSCQGPLDTAHQAMQYTIYDMIKFGGWRVV